MLLDALADHILLTFSDVSIETNLTMILVKRRVNIVIVIVDDGTVRLRVSTKNFSSKSVGPIDVADPSVDVFGWVTDGIRKYL